MISDVKSDGTWIVVYENSREKKRMGGNNKEVVGVSGDFFVVLEGAWIVTYDENCREIKRMGSSGKIVRGAAGSTFTVKEGPWTVTYDKNCKEQSRRGSQNYQMRIWVFNTPGEDAVDYVYREVRQGRSRFGWGYIDSADLRQLENKSWAEMSEDETICYMKTNFLLRIEPGDWIIHINVPKWGFCTAAQVSGTYRYEPVDNEVGDYRHIFDIDISTIVTFDRNDIGVHPVISRRLKLQGNHWEIRFPQEFESSLQNLKSGSIADTSNNPGIFHLKRDLISPIDEIVKLVQRNHPGKNLEYFLAEVFKNITGVIRDEVKVNGSGWGTDNGADIIVKYESGLPIDRLSMTSTLVIQVKSYEGFIFDENALSQIETAVTHYKADMGLLITTATAAPGFEEKVFELSTKLNKPISLLSGTALGKFILKYANDILFDE